MIDQKLFEKVCYLLMSATGYMLTTDFELGFNFVGKLTVEEMAEIQKAGDAYRNVLHEQQSE